MTRRPALLTEAEFQKIIKESKKPPPYLRSLQMVKQLIRHIQATRKPPIHIHVHTPHDRNAGTGA